MSRSAEGRAGDARRVRVAIAVVVAALVVAAAAAPLVAPSGNPVKTHPAPPLFAAEQTRELGRALASQQTAADRLFQGFRDAHPDLDPAAFRSFALDQLPPPPGAAAQAHELVELRALAAARTPGGTAAARWLELYGRKDVWKLYLRDATETAPPPVRRSAKERLSDTRDLSRTLTAAAQEEFGRQAPSVAEPSLRPGAARAAKLSYPSKHAVYVASELALLSALDPGRRGDFVRMAEQVDYSRLYAAGHFRSDLLAGALLGGLIGDYEVALLDAGRAGTVVGAELPLQS